MKVRSGLIWDYQKSEAKMSVFKVVYRSRAAWHADQSRNEADIEHIITVSRAWNADRGLTGALLVSSYGYAQVLEGPPGEVKTLFERIRVDRRHRDLELLYHDEHPERDFGNWAMALVSPSGQSDIELAATSYRFDVEVPDNADDIRTMLRWLLIDEPATRTHVLH
jgi:hypothetical protein